MLAEAPSIVSHDVSIGVIEATPITTSEQLEAAYTLSIKGRGLSEIESIRAALALRNLGLDALAASRSSDVRPLDDQSDEPLRELCYDYRNAHTTQAEEYFQRIVQWVKQQASPSATLTTEREAKLRDFILGIADEMLAVDAPLSPESSAAMREMGQRIYKAVALLSPVVAVDTTEET